MSDSAKPSPNGSNGRQSGGRFAKGNAGGPGNPHARRVAELRAALLERIADGDLRDIVEMLLSKAKAGDIAAAKEVLDRAIGRPQQGIDLNATSEEPPEEFSVAKQIACYSELSVPYSTWPAMASGWFENWQAGRRVEQRPANWLELEQKVRERCMCWERRR